jgi:serine protease inhibitor
MKNSLLLVTSLLMLMTMAIVSCKKESSEIPKPAHLDLSPQGKMLVAASNDFAFRMFDAVEKTEGAHTNLMVSPLSISMALGMTLNGAANATYDSIRKVLGFDLLTQHEINKNYQALIPFLVNADPLTKVAIANSVWYRTGFQPKASFLDSTSTYFDAWISQLDFTQPASLNSINNWVEQHTNQKIKNMLSELKPEDVMYLINAVYFKGNWTRKFNASDTKPSPFQTPAGQTNVPTMNAQNNFKYFHHSDFSMLELDYGSTNFAMDILLPHQNKTVSDVMGLLNATNFDAWTQQLSVVDNMQIALPKFRFEYEKGLNNILTGLGMGVAFTDYADFSGISTELQLLITEVKHKTYIDVNEEGTEAAAATSIGIGVTSMPPSFIANRPFLFIIRERDTNTILFIGKVCDPLY